MTPTTKAYYSTAELAELCGVPYEQMRRFLKTTSLWKLAFGVKVKRKFWLTDIQNNCPYLWDSILLAERLRNGERLGVPRHDEDDDWSDDD